MGLAHLDHVWVGRSGSVTRGPAGVVPSRLKRKGESDMRKCWGLYHSGEKKNVKKGVPFDCLFRNFSLTTEILVVA